MTKHDTVQHSKQRARKQQPRVHAYVGEEIGRPLVAWLNAGGDELPGVVELIEIAKKYGLAKNPRAQNYWKAEANAILLKYRFAAVIDQIDDAWKLGWMGADSSRGANATAVLEFLRLAEQGLHLNLRRCQKPDCKKWFFARYPHQRFDADQCRLATLASDPARKEERKQYMRKLRLRKKLRSRRG